MSSNNTSNIAPNSITVQISKLVTLNSQYYSLHISKKTCKIAKSSGYIRNGSTLKRKKNKLQSQNSSSLCRTKHPMRAPAMGVVPSFPASGPKPKTKTNTFHVYAILFFWKRFWLCVFAAFYFGLANICKKNWELTNQIDCFLMATCEPWQPTPRMNLKAKKWLRPDLRFTAHTCAGKTEWNLLHTQ